MAIDNISLRRLLRFAMSNAKKRQELLRGDIRSELKKGNGGTSKGGDFYGPFWAAAKNHVKGRSNLAVDVPKLIAANSGRKKLYTLMQKNFLEWWTEKRAWRNEPFNIFDDNVKGDFHIGELGLIIKIDSVLAGTIGCSEHRLVYPYFSEDTKLTPFGVRMALHVLSQALPSYDITSFRVLDVLQGVSFSINDHSLTGNEARELKVTFEALRQERAELMKEYVA